MTTIIALMGPAGSGKSTTADYLVERYGAKHYSFAGPLKEVAMRTLSFTREQLWGTQAQKEAKDPRYGFSPRWFLQRLGTDGCREVFGEDFWVDIAIQKILKEAPTWEAPRLAVIDDCRFVNEARAVRAIGALNPAADAPRGLVWVIESPGCHTVSTDDGTHRSEQEWQIAPADCRLRPRERSIPLLHRAIDLYMEHYTKLTALFGRPVTWPPVPREPRVGDRVRITKGDPNTPSLPVEVLARLDSIDSGDPGLPYRIVTDDDEMWWVGGVEVVEPAA